MFLRIVSSKSFTAKCFKKSFLFKVIAVKKNYNRRVCKCTPSNDRNKDQNRPKSCHNISSAFPLPWSGYKISQANSWLCLCSESGLKVV